MGSSRAAVTRAELDPGEVVGAMNPPLSAPPMWWLGLVGAICLTFIVLVVVTERHLSRSFGGRPSGRDAHGIRPGKSALSRAGARRSGADRRSGAAPRMVFPPKGDRRATRPAPPPETAATEGAGSSGIIGASGGRAARRLNILVITSEAPPIVSGISRSVDRLTAGLRARGHHVDVLSSVQIPRLTLGEVRLSLLAAYWPALARRLHDYDVINLHGPVPTMSDVFLVLSRLTRRLPCPIVYTHHSALQIKGAESLCAVYDRIHGALSARVALTVTTSRYYADLLEASTDRPVRVVPWGVDVRPERLRRRGGLRPLRVLFVGQMRPYKGVEWLLSAVAGCHDIELILVGGGDHLGEYRLFAAELGGTNVQFLGQVPDEDVLAQYDRSDVIALPSVTRAEAFGLVVLEGMAAGCVPVVSDLPGVRDLVSRTGLVVPPRDVGRLRAALLELAGDRGRLDQLSRSARRRAEGLGWDTCVASYEEVLYAAVGARHAGHESAALPNGWGARPSVPRMAAGSRPDGTRRIPAARPPHPNAEPEPRPIVLSRTAGPGSQPSPAMNGRARSRDRTG